MSALDAAPESRSLRSPLEHKSFLRGDLCFWTVAVLALFVQLGVRELWTAEDRWAEVSRWMRISGDYLHPRINGQAYFDKPLLGYWSIVAIGFLKSTIDELAVRLPSALAGLLALFATRYLGRRLWSPRVGRTAGWILLSSEGFLFWARTGQADMENLASIVLALAWYWAAREKPEWLKWAVFYAICFVGAQAKGLAALAVPVIAVVPDLLGEKRWKQCLRPGHWIGLVFGAALYLLPFLAEARTRGDYGASGLALVFRENVQRYVHPFDHVEPFYVYLYYLPLLFLPWSPLFLIALWRNVTGGPRIPATRWLLQATLLVFLFFSLSGSRRSYYILPLLPFCALATATWLEAEPADSRAARVGLRIQAGLCAAAIFALLALAPIGFAVLAHRLELAPALLVAALLIGILASLPWIVQRVGPALLDELAVVRRCAPHLLSSALLMGGTFALLHPDADTLRSRKVFATELHDLDLPASRVAFYRAALANVVFYLDAREPHPVLQESSAVDAFFGAASEPRLLIITQADWRQLSPRLLARDRITIVAQERVSLGEADKKLVAIGTRP